MKKCELCGKIRQTESTSFVGHYCTKCHETNIEESENAVKEIKKEFARKRIQKHHDINRLPDSDTF